MEKAPKSKRTKILAKTENLYGYTKKPAKSKVPDDTKPKKAARTSEITWNSRKTGSERKKTKRGYQNSKNSVFRKRKSVAKEIVKEIPDSGGHEEKYQSQKKKEFFKNMGMLVEIESAQFMSESSQRSGPKSKKQDEKNWNSNSLREKKRDIPRFGRDKGKRGKAQGDDRRGKAEPEQARGNGRTRKAASRVRKQDPVGGNTWNNSERQNLAKSERPKVAEKEHKQSKLLQFGSRKKRDQNRQQKRAPPDLSKSTPTNTVDKIVANLPSPNTRQKKASFKVYKKNAAQLKREELSKKKRMEFHSQQKKEKEKEKNKQAKNKASQRRRNSRGPQNKDKQNRRKYEQGISKGYANKNLDKSGGLRNKGYSSKHNGNMRRKKEKGNDDDTSFGSASGGNRRRPGEHQKKRGKPPRDIDLARGSATERRRPSPQKINPVKTNRANTGKNSKKYRNPYQNKYQIPVFKKKRKIEPRVEKRRTLEQEEGVARDDSWRWEGDSQLPGKDPENRGSGTDSGIGIGDFQEGYLRDQMIPNTNIGQLPQDRVGLTRPGRGMSNPFPQTNNPDSHLMNNEYDHQASRGNPIYEQNRNYPNAHPNDGQDPENDYTNYEIQEINKQQTDEDEDNIESQSCGPSREVNVPRFNTGSARGWDEGEPDMGNFGKLSENLNASPYQSLSNHPVISKSNSEQIVTTKEREKEKRRDFFKKKWGQTPRQTIDYVEGEVGGLMKKTLNSNKGQGPGRSSQNPSRRNGLGRPSGNIIDAKLISQIGQSMNPSRQNERQFNNGYQRQGIEEREQDPFGQKKRSNNQTYENTSQFKKTDLLDPKFDAAIPKLTHMLKSPNNMQASESLDVLIKQKAVDGTADSREIDIRVRKSINMKGLTSELDMIIDGVDSMMISQRSQRTPFQDPGFEERKGVTNLVNLESEGDQQDRKQEEEKEGKKHQSPRKTDRQRADLAKSQTANNQQAPSSWQPTTKRNKMSSPTNLSDMSSDEEVPVPSPEKETPEEHYTPKEYKKGKKESSLEKSSGKMDLLGEPMSLEEARKLKKDLGISGTSQDFQEYLSGNLPEVGTLGESHPFLEGEDLSDNKDKGQNQADFTANGEGRRGVTSTFNRFDYSETGEGGFAARDFDRSRKRDIGDGAERETERDQTNLEKIKEEKRGRQEDRRERERRLKMAEDTAMMTLEFDLSKLTLKEREEIQELENFEEPETDIQDSVNAAPEKIEIENKVMKRISDQTDVETPKDLKEGNKSKSASEKIEEIDELNVSEVTKNLEIKEQDNIEGDTTPIFGKSQIIEKGWKATEHEERLVKSQIISQKKEIINPKFNNSKEKPTQKAKKIRALNPRKIPLYSKKPKKPIKKRFRTPESKDRNNDEILSRPQVLQIAQREKSPIPSFSPKPKETSKLIRSINLSRDSQQWNSKKNSRNPSRKNSSNNSPEKKQPPKKVRTSGMRYSRKLQKKLPPSLTSSLEAKSPRIPSSISASWHSQVSDMRVSLNILSPSSKQKRLNRYARNPVKKEALESEMDKILQSVRNLSKASRSSRERTSSKVSSIEKTKYQLRGTSDKNSPLESKRSRVLKSENNLDRRANKKKNLYFKGRKYTSKFVKQRSHEFNFRPDLSEIQSEASVNLDISIDLEYQMLKCVSCMLYFKQRDLLIHQRNCG